MALEYAQRETDETLCECLCMVAHRGESETVCLRPATTQSQWANDQGLPDAPACAECAEARRTAQSRTRLGHLEPRRR